MERLAVAETVPLETGWVKKRGGPYGPGYSLNHLTIVPIQWGGRAEGRTGVC